MTEIDQSWSLTFRIAFSIILLVVIISKAVVTVHSREQKVNKVSLLVYYAVIAQAVFMVNYYTLFKVFSFMDWTDLGYAVMRTILGSFVFLFVDICLLVLAFYTEMVYNFLRYQREHNATVVAVNIDDHFKKERKVVLRYIVIGVLIVLAPYIFQIIYGIWLLKIDCNVLESEQTLHKKRLNEVVCA